MQFFTRVLSLAAAAAPFIANAAPLTSRATDAEAGKYIIQLKPGTDVASLAAHHDRVRSIAARNVNRRDAGTGVEREFELGDFKGYAGSFDEATIEALKALPEVLFVEPDYTMRISAEETQTRAPWNLGRLSSRTRGASSYVYDSSAGEGTFTYIIDTGIRVTHQDFGGRAQWGFNAVTGSTNTDNNGHGTHVAGTSGGTTYGAAKKTTLVAVKVFDGDSGTTSTVISGLTWAVNDIVAKGRQNTAVINMSLGGSASVTFDAAVTAAWAKDVLIVVAAGNSDQDAAGSSPARSPEVITVGNIEQTDKRYVRIADVAGSNWGTTVDIWAPGTNILSAYFTSDTATATLTGTSMASPLVAGLVSYLRGLEGPMSAADVKARVYALASKNLVTDTKGGANLLAYNGIQD
ncbi:subtilisin-like protease-like protein [Phaeosphaeriaceae sp. PMI808]|nr:subtilisin-like protease-like protein [Phaeosphaeriaceae sp. PMI808]